MPTTIINIAIIAIITIRLVSKVSVVLFVELGSSGVGYGVGLLSSSSYGFYSSSSGVTGAVIS